MDEMTIDGPALIGAAVRLDPLGDDLVQGAACDVSAAGSAAVVEAFRGLNAWTALNGLLAKNAVNELAADVRLAALTYAEWDDTVAPVLSGSHPDLFAV